MTEEELMEMPFKMVCGLAHRYKREAIRILIDSIIDDKVHEFIANYETEKEANGLLNK